MGASKEGSMSVRERINWVLRESQSLLHDIEAPPGVDAEESVFVPTGSSSAPNGASEISTGGGAGIGGDGKEDSCHRESPMSSSSSSEELMGGDDKAESTLALSILLADQLRLLTFLNQRLKREESNAEAVGKERDKLQAALDSERLERNSLLRKNEMLEEQRTKSEAIIKEKEEKIQELECRLTAATTPKSVIHQGTRMTPLPPPDELQNEEDDGDMSPRKRRKLDARGGDITASSSNDLSESCTFTPPQTYHTKFIARNRRSDSPPQLSPAVALKSTAQNSRIRGSGNRELPKFLAGDQVDDSVSEYPLDEFQDELDRISYLSQHNRGEGTRSQIGPPDRLLQSGSSAFSRPLPRPRQLARVMLPENTRRFVSQSPLKSMQQFRQSLQHSTTLSNSLAPKNSTTSSDTSLSREPPQLISIRNNNFLNMSRPIARRPPTAPFTPTSSQCSQLGPLSEDTSQQSLSRSLESSEVVKANDEVTVTPETPVVKKRRPGRPLGFRPKKREPVISPWSASSVGHTDTRLSNGLRDDLLSKSEPPAPRFSKRGRLLKPNRARYSPDPDNSTHSREKFMTTKKNYYVSEPFVPEGYGGSLDGTMNSDTLLGADVDCLSRKGIEEEEPISLRTSEKEIGEGDGTVAFVEVPQWRVIVNEGYEDGEERNPPEDDMSEEAFVKRHQKPEVQEKQRKRWDLQMLREESYKERMQRKQAERERQKELRRQQRKRKGRAGATEEEIVNPSVEDIKAIYVGQELPVGAFGQTLPINEKVDFHFSIGCASPPPALPSPKPTTTLVNANIDVISSCNVRESESCSSSAVTLVVSVNKEEADMSDRLVSEETELPAVTLEGRLTGPSSTTSPQPPLPSPTSSSSLSLPSIPSPVPQSSTPPPPVIFCIRDNDKVKDVYEYTEDDDNLLAPSLITSLSISDRAYKTTSSSIEKKQESELPSPSIDSSSTNIVSDDDSSTLSSITSSPVITSSSVAIISSSPRIHSSVTIPLSVPSIKGRSGSGGCGGQITFVNQLENLTMIRCPISSSTTMPKSASIKFLIPNNPLARPRMSSISSSCSTSSSGSSSSVKLSDDDEHSCKDKDLQS